MGACRFQVSDMECELTQASKRPAHAPPVPHLLAEGEALLKPFPGCVVIRLIERDISQAEERPDDALLVSKLTLKRQAFFQKLARRLDLTLEPHGPPEPVQAVGDPPRVTHL